MRRFKKFLHNQSGIALITVILIISILVAAALELNRSSRADVYNAANVSDGIRLLYIARSGFYGGAAVLANSDKPYDTLRDDWARAETLSAQSRALFADGHFIVKIEDEKGKIPLNKLVTGGTVNADIKDMLLRLLKEPEFGLTDRRAGEIVDAIIDWIDENDEITGVGAESSYYATLAAPYAAKNEALDCIEELLMVRGITNELFSGTKDKPGLAQFVTIHGTGTISINTAPKMVLRVLSPDITVEMAEKMDEFRRNQNNNLASPDWYKQVSGLADATIKPTLIDVAKSNYFGIYATGVTERMSQNVRGVIQRSPFRIMSWRQD